MREEKEEKKKKRRKEKRTAPSFSSGPSFSEFPSFDLAKLQIHHLHFIHSKNNPSCLSFSAVPPRCPQQRRLLLLRLKLR
jgi:hypothetical protein